MNRPCKQRAVERSFVKGSSNHGGKLLPDRTGGEATGWSSYHLRRLCEAGEIAAEISAGQQSKVPFAEVARLNSFGYKARWAAEDGNKSGERNADL